MVDEWLATQRGADGGGAGDAHHLWQVTHNAVLGAGAQKVSMRSPYMLPTIAVIDPLLTVSGHDSLTKCPWMRNPYMLPTIAVIINPPLTVSGQATRDGRHESFQL